MEEPSSHNEDPSYPIRVSSTPSIASTRIPSLAFGLYKIPNSEEGTKILTDAILEAGYRHLDSASIYGNEKALGVALANCFAASKTLCRKDLFVASKVWNDAQKEGRPFVRKSVLQSLEDLGLDCLDLCYVHWPVPGHFVDTYRELLVLQKEGKIKHLGTSNFRIRDYEELVQGIPPKDFVPPVVNQFEVSPFVYRPKTIRYFQDRGILVAASKALHRAEGLYDDSSSAAVVRSIAKSHSITPAQVLLRWSFQKGLVVLTKTTSLSRMEENRNILGFVLSKDEMDQLDAITTPETIRAREELEDLRRSS